jgi:predicted nucleic acid-binding protein
MSWEEIGGALAAIRDLCSSPIPLTLDTHGAGLRIAAKYGFAFYDALIAAAALEAQCTTLYSEDSRTASCWRADSPFAIHCARDGTNFQER